MTLVIATPLSPPDIGGPATHCARATALFKARDIEHSVVSFRKVRHLPSGIRHLLFFWRLWRASKGASTLYALDASSVGLPAVFVARLRGMRFVVRIAGVSAWEVGMERGKVHRLLDEFLETRRTYPLSIRLRLWFERFVLRRAHTVVVPSEYFKSVVMRLGVPEGSIRVIYSGFEPRHDAHVLTETREAGLVVSAGRLVPWKGFSVLCEAMALVRERFPQARLVIAGDGEGRAQLEREIEQANAREYIQLVGSLSSEKLQELLARARVFVLNTGYEGLSHQLLEVMDAGVPIVTTPAGGNPELIKDRKEGLLVPYNDRDALAEALIEILVDAKLAQSLAYNAYRKAREFSNKHTDEALVTLFTP